MYAPAPHHKTHACVFRQFDAVIQKCAKTMLKLFLRLLALIGIISAVFAIADMAKKMSQETLDTAVQFASAVVVVPVFCAVFFLAGKFSK